MVVFVNWIIILAVVCNVFFSLTPNGCNFDYDNPCFYSFTSVQIKLLCFLLR